MALVGLRWLQFASGGAAGGLFIGDTEPDENLVVGVPTMTPSTAISSVDSIANTGDDQEAETQMSIGRATNVLIIIAAGIATVLGLLVLTWVLAKLFDQYCCCFPFFRPVSSTEVFDRSSVSRKAGLWGLLQKERMKILQHLFQPVDWSSTTDEEGNVRGCSKSHGNTPESTGNTNADIAMQGQGSLPEASSHHNNRSNPVDDIQHQRVCCICLNPYQPGCHVLMGKTCSHMFHYDCCMKWLKDHDECPYCRQELVTGQQFREAALRVLSESRVRELNGAWVQGQENSEGDNDNNGNDRSSESSPGQSQQLVQQGEAVIEMRRIVVHQEDALEESTVSVEA